MKNNVIKQGTYTDSIFFSSIHLSLSHFSLFHSLSLSQSLYQSLIQSFSPSSFHNFYLWYFRCITSRSNKKKLNFIELSISKNKHQIYLLNLCNDITCVFVCVSEYMIADSHIHIYYIIHRLHTKCVYDFFFFGYHWWNGIMYVFFFISFLQHITYKCSF